MADTIPDVVAVRSLADYLEVMTRAVFQAGVRWKDIARHWDVYQRVFVNFNPERVAEYQEGDVEIILATPGVLRMRRKVLATIANARALLAVDREFEGFAQYLRSFSSYADLAKDFKRRFSFMGDMNVWYFLFRVGEPVPRFEEWVKTIPGDHPRMREMVDRARAHNRSPEVPHIPAGT
ncbi:MAG: DNA-3-methyladenine glycosylase I [Candidatus Eremiobacteraeota bacterium]|nr:DNA-3-methyladenine glycosylase I [Candidatus Eremiobacteraeota bacterium]